MENRLSEHYMYEIREAILEENGLEEFEGWCDIASVLLSEIMKRHHNLDIKVISGAFETDEERKGHYWNEFEGKVIDITSDQFGIEEGFIDQNVFEEYYIGRKVVNFSDSEIIYQKYINHIELIK